MTIVRLSVVEDGMPGYEAIVLNVQVTVTETTLLPPASVLVVGVETVGAGLRPPASASAAAWAFA